MGDLLQFPADRIVQENYLPKRALARALGRSTRWVEQQTAAGMPASRSPNGHRRYRLSEVLAWLDAREAFMATVEKGEECWLWTGGRGQNGYGYLRRDSVVCLAHRYSYELHVGPIPEGKELHHTCDTPLCVNPEHLQPVTRREHMHLGRKDECKNGHPFDEANTYIHPETGRRTCRTCRRLNMRRYKKALV